MIDGVDRKIIELLQEDGRLSNAALAEKVGLTTSSVYERVRKLERKGIIKGYVAVVDPEALGKSITAFIRLSVGATDEYIASKNKIMEVCLTDPDILECYGVAGEDCYILKARVANPKELERLIERIRSRARLARTVTSIVLTTFKETTAIVPPANE